MHQHDSQSDTSLDLLPMAVSRALILLLRLLTCSQRFILVAIAYFNVGLLSVCG